MTLTSDQKDYVAGLVALLRSDQPLEPSQHGPDDGIVHTSVGKRSGLFRDERDMIADIVEWFFKRKESKSKKRGRPPNTLLERWDLNSRFLKYHKLISRELQDGKSYDEAIAGAIKKASEQTKGKKKDLKPSSLKRYLPARSFQVEPYTDEERALFAEGDEQFKYLCLVQDEINAGKPYADAIRTVAKRKGIDPTRLRRIMKSFFE
jgi:hypothetical protein